MERLDEPTAGLDPASLFTTLAGLNAGIVLATHDVKQLVALPPEGIRA